MNKRLKRNIFLCLSLTLYGIHSFSTADTEGGSSSNNMVSHSVIETIDSGEEGGKRIPRTLRRGNEHDLRKTRREKPGKTLSSEGDSDDSAVEAEKIPSARRRGRLVLEKALTPAARDYIGELMRRIETAGPDGATRWNTLKQYLSTESNA